MLESKSVRKDAWRGATVRVLLQIRFLAVRNGTNPRKVWDMLSERALLATRTVSTAQEWVSRIMAEFQLPVADPATSDLLIELVGCVGPDVRAWMNLVDAEHQFIFAMARLQFESEMKDRKASKGLAAETAPKQPSPTRRRKNKEPA